MLVNSFDFSLQLEIISNQTDTPQFNSGRESRNTSITLRGFQPERTYRFYCVRNSDGRIYSQSVVVNCTKSLP